MPGHAADRNLLFGILALQMDLVTRDQLVAGMNAWVLEKHRPLGDILVERGALEQGQLDALEAMLACHVAKHAGDPAASLASLSSAGGMASDLQRSIADPEVQESLRFVPPPWAGDPYSARAALDPGPTTAEPSTFQEDDPYATRPHIPQHEAPPSGARYRKIREHARGGLGVVFLARDAELNREVALKEIKGDHADHAYNRAKFLQEAEVTGGLEHPGIVPVYGLGHHEDGRPFYAMRFIKGDSLRQAIAAFHGDESLKANTGRRALELQKLLRRFLDVCNAIDYAHSRGVLHRDLKPDNVMVGRYGETLVVDWGLAKAIGRSGAEPGSLPEATLVPSEVSGSEETLPGSVVGTPAYMSPEQAEGRLDLMGSASDIYSLGATLFCLITGRAPVVGKNLADLLRKVKAGEVTRPRTIAPWLDAALEAICLKALALEPVARYTTPLALADDLEHWLADESVSALPEDLSRRLARWARRHRTWAQAGAAALVSVTLVSIAAALFVDHSRRLAEVRRIEAETQKGEADRERNKAQMTTARLFLDRGLLLSEQGNVGDGLLWMLRGLKVVPDESDLLDDPEVVALRWIIRTQMHVSARHLHALQGILGHQNLGTAVAFSPDGKTVLISDMSTARLWDAATGRPVGEPMTHQGWVNAVAFSPDGRAVLTGSPDGRAVLTGSLNGTARLWEAATGRPIGEPMTHQNLISAVAFSPDGRAVLTGSEDKTARLWDAATGRPIGEPMTHQNRVNAVAFSPDGRAVLTGSLDDTARLWDSATGRPIGEPMNHQGWVVAVAFSPDGRAVLTGSEDKTARLWDSATGRPIGEPMNHQGWVVAVAFSPDGRAVLTRSDNGIVRLWDAATAAAFSPDGRAVLTGSEDKTTRLWDAATGRPFGEPMTHKGLVDAVGLSAWVNAVAFSPDGRAVLTGSEDKTARLWDSATGRPVGEPMTHQNSVLAVAFSPDGRAVLTGSEDKTARLWDAATGRPVGEPMTHQNSVLAVAFSPDGRAVLTRSEDKTAGLWDAATGRPIGEPMTHQGRVNAVAFSPDGRAVLTGSEDKTARLWEAATGRPVGEPMTHQNSVDAVAFSPDGRAVLTGSLDRTARLWDAATGRPIGEPMTHQGRVNAVAFSPDGRAVLTGSLNGTARLWDAATGRPIGEPMNHQGWVVAVAFSPDGRAVLTGSLDDTARLWDAATGRPIGEPMTHQGRVNAVAFSPDGRAVLTGSEDKTARLWEAATGRPIGEPMTHQGSVLAVTFSPDGRAVLTGSLDHTTRLWVVPFPLEGNIERIGFWAELVTGKTLREAGGGIGTLDSQTWYETRRRLEVLGGPPLGSVPSPQH